MTRRPRRSRRLVLLLSAVVLATLSPTVPPVAGAEETGPAKPVKLPVQQGDENTLDLVRRQTPADIDITEPGGGAVPDPGTKRVTPPRDVAPAAKTDVAAQRAEYSSITANPDGTYTATITGDRQNYQDTSGKWQPIDTSLVVDETDGFTLRSKANDRVVRIDEQPVDGVVATIEAGSHRVRLISPAAKTGTLDKADNAVDFSTGAGDGLVVAPTPEGLEYRFRLIGPTSSRVLEVTIDTDGLLATLDKDGRTIHLVDDQGEIAASITAPITYDAAGVVADDTLTTVEVGSLDKVPSEPDPSPAPVSTPEPTSEPDPRPTTAPEGSPSADPAASATPDAAPSATASEQAAPSSTPSGSIGSAQSVGPSDVVAAPAASSSPEPGSPSPELSSPGPSATAATATPGVASPSPSPSASPPVPSEGPTATRPVGVRPIPGPVIVTYRIADTWLDDPARVYPVVLDPIITIQADGSGATDCDAAVGSTLGYDDWIAQSGHPLCSSRMRIGTTSEGDGYGIMRGLFFFKGLSLGSGTWADDGQQITNATFSLYKYSGAARSIQSTLITGEGWASPANWDNQVGQGGDESIKYLCADAVTTTCSAGTAYYTASVTTPSGNGWVDQDVSELVRRWYTKRSQDWLPNLGMMTRLVTESQSENLFRNSSYSTTSDRPKLTITFVAPHVGIDFDTTTLGATFSPSTMVRGSTVRLPVRIRNSGSAITFYKWTSGSSDYWKVGYRWLDAKGKLVKISGFTPTGFVNLDVDVLPSGVSGYLALPVLAPPNAGEYTLRLDLVHQVGSSMLWASDWAKPSTFNARAKAPQSTPADVRWVGSSIVEKAEFGMSVVAGGGPSVGETKTIDLADGTTVGLNLWSRNLSIEADAGIGFADLGTDIGLGYHYHSADKDTCDSLVLRACGWGTVYDERFERGANGTDLIYRNGAGDRYFVDANGSGQLVSAAPARIERPRITVFDDNTLAWTGSVGHTSAYQWAGSSSLTIGSNSSATSTDIVPIELADYPFVSFASYAPVTGRSAIGFLIHDATKGTDTWFYYAIGGTSQWAPLGAGVSKWTGPNAMASHFESFDQLDLYADARLAMTGESYELSVTGVAIRGADTGSATAYHDALRFEGRRSLVMDGNLPANTTCGAGSCGSTEALEVTDPTAPEGTTSLKVWSPASPGIGSAPTTVTTYEVTRHEYVTWSWRKVGGATVAVGFLVADKRDPSKSGWIYYYAGSTPTGLPSGAVALQVAAQVPETWSTVTRNLADDARQVHGFFDDVPASSPTTPGSGPVPDPVERQKVQFVAYDGEYAHFDWMVHTSIPAPVGDQYGDPQGDDFLVTERSGAVHTFDQDGRLTGLLDRDGNRTDVRWIYDWSTRTAALDQVIAPADGLPRTGGTAGRRLVVSSTSTSVRFTESLNGSNQRYAEFVRDAATGGNLTKVIPGRRSAACAVSGATGCQTFAWNTSHRPTTIRDARSTGADQQALTVSYFGTAPYDVQSLAKSSGGTLLKVLNYDVVGGPPTGQTRVRWQDADGTATGTNGYARHTDLSPNGSVMTEWAPSGCASAACASGGAATDREATFESDGIDQTTTETRYRLPGSAAPVTTRRGTLAAARVDNYADPLTAGLTAWTQSPDQAAASTSTTPGAPGFFATTFTYTDDGDVATTSTPHANPAGGDPVQTIATTYDEEGHPIQVDDNRFLTWDPLESTCRHASLSIL